MTDTNFTYSFKTSKTSAEVFPLLLNISQWWSGLYEETVVGESQKTGDEFVFFAAAGPHYSKQELVQLEPEKKITWLVKVSDLSFLSKTDEWTGTRFGFDISNENTGASVTFTHQGLTPEIECYNACSGGWTQYLAQLEQKLK